MEKACCDTHLIEQKLFPRHRCAVRAAPSPLLASLHWHCPLLPPFQAFQLYSHKSGRAVLSPCIYSTAYGFSLFFDAAASLPIPLHTNTLTVG